ncbi:MAG TPA: DUF6526 family protein [Gemmatimonadaceae bacterium]|jgi:hypothetical protein|nr:DUF6526 family protein [Gemmatimonadaceae bacterium]
MPPKAQTYANHRRYFPLYHFFAVPILLLNVAVAVSDVVRRPGLHTGWAVLVAVALVALALAARASTLIVQNRLIGLEMRLRLTAVLPQELRPRIGDLTLNQIIGLRFASDAELPALVERCLAGELRTADAVKKQVRDWRPDLVRA